jgi:hypothetical protein
VIHRKAEGKRSLECPRPRWEDNIKMDLEDLGFKRVDWTQV